MESYDNHLAAKPFNTLGLMGFVFSLTCVLSPLGLLLSFFAIFKPAKGFAIAGLILGLLGTGIVGVTYFGVSAARNSGGFDSNLNYLEYLFDGFQLQGALEPYVGNSGRLPSSPDDLAVEDAARVDPWGNKYRFGAAQIVSSTENSTDAGSYYLIAVESAGPDGEWGTSDDKPVKTESKSPFTGYLMVKQYLVKTEQAPSDDTNKDLEGK